MRFRIGNIRKLQMSALCLLAVLLSAILWVAIITDSNKDLSNSNPIIMYTVEHHLVILIALVIISISFGFIWAHLTFRELRKTKNQTKSILDTVLLFLSREEKDIVNYLVENKGNTTQAEISRLPSMNRVKAYRSLQKMQDKKLVEVISHGKVRKVRLRENIYNVLKEN